MIKKLIILIVVVLASCKNETTPTYIFTIKPNQSESLDNISLSSLLKSYRIVFLETNVNSVFGTVDKIIKKNGHFYISSDLKSLHIFSDEGHFLNKIEKKGRGPGEYNELLDFDVTEKYIGILGYKKVNIYNFKGELLKVLRLKFVAKKMKFTSNMNIIFQTSGERETLFLTDSNGVKINSFLKTDITSRLTRKIPFNNLDQKTMVFQIGYTNNIVCYDELSGKFSHANLLSNSNVLDVNKYRELQVNFGIEAMKNATNYICLDGISSNGSNFMFGYSLKNQIDLCIFNNSRQLISDIKISPTINILDDISFTDPSFLGLASSAQGDSCFISYIFPRKIKDGLIKFIAKNPAYLNNSHYQKTNESIAKSSQDDNPCLIEYTFIN